MAILPVGIGSAEEGGYQIERSLRFNSADSAYLNRTPASAGNRKTWTWSGWVKRSALGSSQTLFGLDPSTNDNTNFFIEFRNTDHLGIAAYNINWRVTTQVFRDPSAWYHIVVVVDTTQSTANDRIKLYVNGQQITAFSTTNNPSQNADLGVNQASAHNIGRVTSGSLYYNGYLTEINFIDGSALDPTSFGEYNSDTGVWQPKAYTGSYGTNGFYLDFADNSGTTSTTLGADSSGNGNNWTPNNFSVTAGAGNDSLVDSPTRYGTDIGIGNEVRGNYNTINPLDKGSGLTISNGNLDHLADSSGNWYQARSTIAIPSSGKWYWEFTFSAGTAGFCAAGLSPSTVALTMGFGPGTYGNYYGMTLDGTLYANNSSTGSYGSSFTSGDVLMVAFDRDNSKIYFGKNGTWFNSSNPATQTNPAASSISTTATLFPGVGGVNSSGGSSNFGARPFAYTAPSGFRSLCTTNLPEPTIADGGEYFNTVLYTGNGSTQSITGVGFQPDFVWIKGRSTALDHRLVDAVRGVQLELVSNNTNAENNNANGLTAFSSDGFTVGSAFGYNRSTEALVAWNWKANGSGVSNTDGTITSTVSANTTSGVSIVSYTGTGANATVGHGLGVAPAMVIVKNRTSAYDWSVWHTSLSANNVLTLNSTAAQFNPSTDHFQSTPVTSSVINLATNLSTNESGATFVAYCFASVAGFSSMGSYVGNGSADGPFVYTGFRPRYVMVKRTDSGGGWSIKDTSRDPYNAAANELNANLSDAEYANTFPLDIISNGFKIRSSSLGINASGGTYIYACFAENPFAYSLAR